MFLAVQEPRKIWHRGRIRSQCIVRGSVDILPNHSLHGDSFRATRNSHDTGEGLQSTRHGGIGQVWVVHRDSHFRKEWGPYRRRWS